MTLNSFRIRTYEHSLKIDADDAARVRHLEHDVPLTAAEEDRARRKKAYEEQAKVRAIYEYLCEECETRFEKIVINKQQEIACPKCASKKASIQLSVFATANGGANGASAKSSTPSFGGGGSCCGGGCGCN